jgi:hypothetical protein
MSELSIETYQRVVFASMAPDSRVDSGGRTLAALSANEKTTRLALP